MSRGPRRWYTGSIGTRLSIERRTCPRCGRRGALAIGHIGDELITYCHWARRGLCDWPPPFPPAQTVPWKPPPRVELAGPVVLDLRTQQRPPFRPPENQADAIAWMVKLRAEGHSIEAVARMLDAAGYRPPRAERWNGVTVKRWLCWHDGEPFVPWERKFRSQTSG